MHRTSVVIIMYLLFDIGGTRTRLAYSSDGEKFGAPVIIDTPADFNHGLKAISEIGRDLIKGRPLRGLAGGIAGPLNREKSILINPPNLPGWDHMPIKTRLAEAFDVPVKLENDSAVVGLGEAAVGAGHGHEIVAYITVSTGIGGARIVNGAIDVSISGFEPGHQIIDLDGTALADNPHGELEKFASGTAVKARYEQEPWEIKDDRVWDDLAHYLAVGLHNTILHWSPSILVLGGAMMTKKPGIAIEKVELELKTLMKTFPSLPKLVTAQLGSIGGLHGALVLARDIRD